MKKIIVFAVFMFAMTVVFGQADTTVVHPSGIAGFFSKYWDTIMVILGALGVTGFVTFRAGKLRDAFDQIVKAGEDGSVSEVEFQAILKALKAIWGKKDA